ncbi:EAL domain-containing protein [Stieleria varia]|nr:EAL domain-containing protein [Stieleria varia]
MKMSEAATGTSNPYTSTNTSEWTLTEIGKSSDQLRTFHVPSPTCLVGRTSTAGLRIADASVSKSHARLFSDREQLFVEDLGSTNGTTVNGVIIDRCELFDGDLVQFANIVFRVNGQTPPDMAGTIQNVSGTWVNTLLSFEQLMNDRAVVPHFQRIVAMKDQRITAYELLARSNIENLRMAGEMFATAERLQQHVALSELMREEGCRVASDSSRRQSRFFFNIHPQEFGTLRLSQSLISMRDSFPDLNITIEIHESVIANTVAMKQFQNTLKSLNMSLSYDDFGAGQGRLLELTEVPPDVLKFDMQLIRDIDEAPASRQELVRSLVRIATDNGSIALAEGIETEAEHEVCQQLGFRLAQGYYYGKAELLD